MLGGARNFAVDREVAERIERTVPSSIRTTWENRAFLRRAVQYRAAQGIDHFLDIGSGIPAKGNMHEIARAVSPNARVVYVDLDPVAVMQSRTILADDTLSGVLNADLCKPERSWTTRSPGGCSTSTDRSRCAIVALLHVISDTADPADLVARLTSRMTPGSHL
jgi:hypothetical protein